MIGSFDDLSWGPWGLELHGQQEQHQMKGMSLYAYEEWTMRNGPLQHSNTPPGDSHIQIQPINSPPRVHRLQVPACQ